MTEALEGYDSPGLEKAVTLTPKEVTALHTLSGWQHAMSYLKKTYRGDRTSDGRDSIDGWVQEFLDAVQVMEALGKRLDHD